MGILYIIIFPEKICNCTSRKKRTSENHSNVILQSHLKKGAIQVNPVWVLERNRVINEVGRVHVLFPLSDLSSDSSYKVHRVTVPNEISGLVST